MLTPAVITSNPVIIKEAWIEKGDISVTFLVEAIFYYLSVLLGPIPTVIFSDVEPNLLHETLTSKISPLAASTL